jgi:hypothetical protein
MTDVFGAGHVYPSGTPHFNLSQSNVFCIICCQAFFYFFFILVIGMLFFTSWYLLIALFGSSAFFIKGCNPSYMITSLTRTQQPIPPNIENTFSILLGSMGSDTCTPNPCQNGGTCFRSVVNPFYICTCPQDKNGVHRESKYYHVYLYEHMS